jgi:hypothetical protein
VRGGAVGGGGEERRVVVRGLQSESINDGRRNVRKKDGGRWVSVGVDNVVLFLNIFQPSRNEDVGLMSKTLTLVAGDMPFVYVHIYHIENSGSDRETMRY